MDALNANTGGYQNIGIGFMALLGNTTGYGNIAISPDHGQYQNTSYQNTSVGLQSQEKRRRPKQFLARRLCPGGQTREGRLIRRWALYSMAPEGSLSASISQRLDWLRGALPIAQFRRFEQQHGHRRGGPLRAQQRPDRQYRQQQHRTRLRGREQRRQRHQQYLHRPPRQRIRVQQYLPRQRADQHPVCRSRQFPHST